MHSDANAPFHVTLPRIMPKVLFSSKVPPKHDEEDQGNGKKQAPK